MDVRDILESVRSGGMSIDDARRMISLHSIEHVEGLANIDMDRGMRRGIPEIILAERKSLTETREIIRRVLAGSDMVIVSRLSDDHYPKIKEHAGTVGASVRTGRDCTTLVLYRKEPEPCGGAVGIITAGTSDIGIAEESRLVCEAMGCRCITGYDVGVAGIHRIFPVIKEMIRGDVECIIVAAGMEGALATLVSSMVDVPVVGVPTSVGYGYGAGGTAALASMLQSCALGLSVVNIDGGVAAGAVAANIANRASGRKSRK